VVLSVADAVLHIDRAVPARWLPSLPKHTLCGIMAPFIENGTIQEKSAQFPSLPVEEVIQQLTLDEKVSLLTGEHTPSYVGKIQFG
jgi:hypothetical protein